MTGFGAASGQAAGYKVMVELRSLNSKFLEINLKLPSLFRDKEAELRVELTKTVERGKMDAIVTFENNELARKSTINKEIFKAYYDELKAIALEANILENNWADTILKLPNVLNSDRSELAPEQWNELLTLVRLAMEKFNQFRREEGIVLEADLAGRINTILTLLTEIVPYEKVRIENIKSRMLKNINDIKQETTIDPNRFEQELIYYIERLDVSEEKLRLKSHCDYFIETMKTGEANGKKLGFIAQEIGREINTLGAKANDAVIQRKIVEMKDELEKLKEQLANVL